jgi:hypothetical protein
MIKRMLLVGVMLVSNIAFAQESFMGFTLGQGEAKTQKNAEARGYRWERKSTTQGVQECIANKGNSENIDFFILHFIDNKLYLIEYMFSPGQYARIQHAMLSKYGEPAASEQRTARNASGSMPSQVSTWVLSTSSLMILAERNPDGARFSFVKLFNKNLYKTASSKLPSNDPKL